MRFKAMWRRLLEWRAGRGRRARRGRRRVDFVYQSPTAVRQETAKSWQRLARVAVPFTVALIVCGYLDFTAFAWFEHYTYVLRMDVHRQYHGDLTERARQQVALVTISDDMFDGPAPVEPAAQNDPVEKELHRVEKQFAQLQGPPLPRDYHARVMRQLMQENAKVIAFDLVFDIPRNKEDRELAAAARQSRRVLWASVKDGPQYALPNAQLRQASPYYGNIFVDRNPDRPALDRIQGILKVENRDGSTEFVPSFSLQAALMSMGLQDKKLHFSDGHWRAGDFILPLDEKGSFLVNFFGKSEEVFSIHPYIDVYNYGVLKKTEFYRDKHLFRDKIVLIGDMTTVGNDSLLTSGGTMWGVEVHAHAIATLLQGLSMRAAPPWANLLTLCAFTGLVCLSATLRRLGWFVLAVIVLQAGYAYLNIWLFVDQGIYLHLFGPLAAMMLATLGVLVERGLREEREKDRMFDSLVLAAASAIEDRDPSTSGHSQRVTVLTVELAKAVSQSSLEAFKGAHFSPAQLRELSYAGMLHDFGKIGVRESVLTKSHKLEPFHFQVVKARLLLLCEGHQNQYARHKIDFLTDELGEPVRQKLQEFDQKFGPQHQAELIELDADLTRLEQANDPLVTFLPDPQHEALRELLDRLGSMTYQNENGVTQPLLTEEEKTALSIRKGSLTFDEYKQVQRHAEMAYNFLRQIPWTEDLKHIPHIAHCHHEKLNGSGYPRGIKDLEIPLQARIMTIADIYDALTAADRPYKKAMPPEKALNILRAEARDGCLDSTLVELFIAAEVYKATSELPASVRDVKLDKAPAPAY